MKFKKEYGVTNSPLLSLFGQESFNGNHYW